MKECPELHSIPRSDWTMRNATQELEYLQLPMNLMVFTHTYLDTCNSTVTCLPLVKLIQDMHMGPSFNFSDIAYHFLIGGDGSVFEAREWHIKGAFNRKYNKWGFGTAFLGKFSVEGNDFHGLPYEAALSAHKLFKCALRNNYLDPNNHSVITSRINPMIKNYILYPELLRPSTLSTRTTSTLGGVQAITDTVPTSRKPTAETTATTHAPPLFTDAAVAGMVLGTGVLAFLIVFLASYFCRCRKNEKSAKDYRTAVHKIVPQNVVALYEKPRWSFDLQDAHLVMGQHGQVHQGSLMEKNPPNRFRRIMTGSRPVAVKALRDSHTSEEIDKFLEEMGTLMKVGRHANIVNLEGVVLQGKLMMATEHCEIGSLENYLRKQKVDRDGPCIASGELMNIAHQISRGMEFLSCKDVIHGDLAARNIFLDAQKTAKIGNFGMAREQDEYIPDREVPLLVCWMAPESVIPEARICSTRCDVWSFGVVLWEVFTFGDIPYATEFPSGVLYEQLSSFLVQGHRLEIPQGSPELIGRLMTECWNFHRKERPAFPVLRQNLETLLPVAERGQYITCDQKSEELCNRLMDQSGITSAVPTDQP